jgi:hypothetical protein
MAKKQQTYPDIDKAIKAMLSLAETFEEKRQAIETAMKFEALKLKARGNDFGKGFDDDGGDDDSSF